MGWLLVNVGELLEHQCALFEDVGWLLEKLSDILENRNYIRTFLGLLEHCRSLLELFTYLLFYLKLFPAYRRRIEQLEVYG